MNNDELVVPILRAINDLREEVRDNKREIREMREENNKRWDENDKRWEENDKRWEENSELWKNNEKNKERDHKEIIDLLIRYDAAVSRKLGDPNANKMLKLLK